MSLEAQATNWTVIRNAVPKELCEKVALEVAQAEAAHTAEEQIQYRSTPSSRPIYDHIAEKWLKEILRFNPDARATSITIVKLRKLQRALKISGKEGEIYFVLALTPLTEQTGMFALQGYRNPGSSPSVEAQVPRLEIGDAVIWTGNNAGRGGLGEDGLMLVAVYN